MNEPRILTKYFDAMLIRLTAIPKSEVDNKTYVLFDTEDGNPTFAYGVNSAVHTHSSFGEFLRL